jgi:outer membrane protein assembly factor BamB
MRDTATSDATTTSTTTAASIRPDGPAIVWQIEHWCADSIVASGRIIVVNCDGSVSAHARADGTFLWAQETNDDGANTPGITADDTVVYTPFDYPEGAMAFDGTTGREVHVPTAGVRTTYSGFDPPDEEILPTGYSYGPTGLSYGDALIWPGGRPDVTGIGPYVHRQAGVTVINGHDAGMQVVADDGTVLLAPQWGEWSAVPSPVWDVGHDQAAMAGSDGVVLLDLRQRSGVGSGTPTDQRQ